MKVSLQQWLVMLPFFILQVAQRLRTPPANAGGIRGIGSLPGSGRAPGGQNGNQLQYSCLGNPMDREPRWAIVHWVTKNWTRLSTHTQFRHTSLHFPFQFLHISYFVTTTLLIAIALME